MLTNAAVLASCAAIVAAAPAPVAEPIKVALGASHRYAPRADGTVDAATFLVNVNNTLKKYHATPLPSYGLDQGLLSSILRKRATGTVPLTDQVESGQIDELYYGNVVVGSSSPQTFTTDFDTGSADFFVPGPQCTTANGCTGTVRYNQDGTDEHNTTSVTYGSGSISGENYYDTVTVGGLTAPHTNVISLTTAQGFSGSDAEGLMGMGFSTIANSKQPTFFENLIANKAVTQNQFSFYLGRAKSNTQGASEMVLGGNNPAKYSGTPKSNPVTTKGYWQIALANVKVNGVSAPTSPGQAAIDTGTTVIVAPTAAAASIFALIPGAFPVPLISGSPLETIFAYPCNTATKYIPTITFGGVSYAINPLDFNLGSLTSDFADIVQSSKLSDALAAAPAGGICLAAIIAADFQPTENLYVVGDSFLKNWYSIYSYDNGASVSFAKAVGNQ